MHIKPTHSTQAHRTTLPYCNRWDSTGVSQTELQQILSQLCSLIHSTVPSPPPPSVVPPPSLQWQNQSFAGPSQPMPPTAFISRINLTRLVPTSRRKVFQLCCHPVFQGSRTSTSFFHSSRPVLFLPVRHRTTPHLAARRRLA